jgi:hypothetical protein
MSSNDVKTENFEAAETLREMADEIEASDRQTIAVGVFYFTDMREGQSAHWINPDEVSMDTVREFQGYVREGIRDHLHRSHGHLSKKQMREMEAAREARFREKNEAIFRELEAMGIPRSNFVSKKGARN